MQFTADFFTQAQACLEQVVRQYRPTLLAAQGKVAAEQKQDKSLVTALDKELEQLLRNALTKFDASIGFVGEEFGQSGNHETFWLLDPVDGTENFVRGLPAVLNMATLVSGGKPVFAFVYKVTTDELFIATEGGGTTKNGVPVQVSKRPLARSLVELTSSRIAEPAVARLIAAVEPKVYRIRRFDDYSYVVDGRVDMHIVYKSGGGDWDYAPQSLLLAEAGARVANLGSDTFDYKNHNYLAAHPAVFDEIMQAITNELRPEEL